MTNKPSPDNQPEANIHTRGPVNEKGTSPAPQPQGWLPKFFGGVEHAPASISGFVLVLLICIGAALTFKETKVDPTDFWKTIVLPTTTALFGYLFGKGKK